MNTLSTLILENQQLEINYAELKTRENETSKQK